MLEIDTGILDDAICANYWADEFAVWTRWAASYIEERRKDDPNIWGPFERKTAEWQRAPASGGS